MRRDCAWVAWSNLPWPVNGEATAWTRGRTGRARQPERKEARLVEASRLPLRQSYPIPCLDLERASFHVYICSVGLVIWRLALVRAGPEAAGRSLRSSAPADHRHVTDVTGRF
jgi:hypothetical protein